MVVRMFVIINVLRRMFRVLIRMIGMRSFDCDGALPTLYYRRNIDACVDQFTGVALQNENKSFGAIKMASARSTAAFCSAVTAAVSKPTRLCAGELNVICTSLPSEDKSNSAAPCSCAPPAAQALLKPQAIALKINRHRDLQDAWSTYGKCLACTGGPAGFEVQCMT